MLLSPRAHGAPLRAPPLGAWANESVIPDGLSSAAGSFAAHRGDSGEGCRLRAGRGSYRWPPEWSLSRSSQPAGGCSAEPTSSELNGRHPGSRQVAVMLPCSVASRRGSGGAKGAPGARRFPLVTWRRGDASAFVAHPGRGRDAARREVGQMYSRFAVARAGAGKSSDTFLASAGTPKQRPGVWLGARGIGCPGRSRRPLWRRICRSRGCRCGSGVAGPEDPTAGGSSPWPPSYWWWGCSRVLRHVPR